MMNEELNIPTVDEVNTALRDHALPTFTNGSFEVALARVGARRIREGLFGLERNAKAVHFFWYCLIRDCLAVAARGGSVGNHGDVEEAGDRALRDRQEAYQGSRAIQSVSNDVLPKGGHRDRALSPTHGQRYQDVVFACRMEMRPVLVNGVPVSCAIKEPETLVMEGLLRVAS